MRFSLTLLPILATLSACASQNLPPNRPVVDLDPLGCGYKWFQSGYSEYVPWSCAQDRSSLKAPLMQAATEKAWEIAQERCPSTCPPQALQDTVVWQHPKEEGVCREDYVYFFTRLFFQCGMSP